MKNAVAITLVVLNLGFLNIIDAAVASTIPEWSYVGNSFFRIESNRAFHMALYGQFITIWLIGIIYFTGRK